MKETSKTVMLSSDAELSALHRLGCQCGFNRGDSSAGVAAKSKKRVADGNPFARKPKKAC